MVRKLSIIAHIKSEEGKTQMVQQQTVIDWKPSSQYVKKIRPYSISNSAHPHKKFIRLLSIVAFIFNCFTCKYVGDLLLALLAEDERAGESPIVLARRN